MFFVLELGTLVNLHVFDRVTTLPPHRSMEEVDTKAVHKLSHTLLCAILKQLYQKNHLL
jgi:hypothetical protein